MIYHQADDAFRTIQFTHLWLDHYGYTDERPHLSNPPDRTMIELALKADRFPTPHTPELETEILRFEREEIPRFDAQLTALVTWVSKLALAEAASEGAGERDSMEAGNGQQAALAHVNSQYVTVDQAAALVQRSKKTVAKWLNQDGAPLAAVEGGGGKAHEYLWSDLKPFLELKTSRNLPAEYPQLPPR